MAVGMQVHEKSEMWTLDSRVSPRRSPDQELQRERKYRKKMWLGEFRVSAMPRTVEELDSEGARCIAERVASGKMSIAAASETMRRFAGDGASKAGLLN